MILLFDVGNSEIKVASATLNKITQVYHFETPKKGSHIKSSEDYFLVLKEIFVLDQVEGVMISSVVPSVTRVLVKFSREFLKINPTLLKLGIKTELNIISDNPKEVGADLIADSVGSFEYGNDVIIVDLGTANKIIYVKDKTFRGCIISCGINASLHGLVDNTALLFDIEIAKPKKVLGTNTISCMQSGLTYGIAGMIDGLIDRIITENNIDNPTVVMTGGNSKLIAPLCKTNLIVDDNLTLKGILNIYEKNKAR